jgi:sterol desaturase/sphingolipid hydroxylase (fatty acid hydroxylase superfamily)
MLSPVIEERIRNGQTCRMFASDFFEWFSRIHPATPFVTYLPVIGYFFYRIGRRGDLGWASVMGVVLVGFLAWTLAEYVLHRYVFHFIRDAAWAQKLHFFLHGVHHDFPSDKDRLVMPLGASVPMAFLFYGLFYALTGGVRFGEPLYIGFALGYLAYDGTHYAVHHFRQTTRIGKFLKKHHMKHHHGDNFGGFGVSSPLWDLVFRTMPRIVKKSDLATSAPRAA